MNYLRCDYPGLEFSCPVSAEGYMGLGLSEFFIGESFSELYSEGGELQDEKLQEALAGYLTEKLEPAIDFGVNPCGMVDGNALYQHAIESILEFIQTKLCHYWYLEMDGKNTEIGISWLIYFVNSYYDDSSACASLTLPLIFESVEKFFKEGSWNLDKDKEGRPRIWFGTKEEGPLAIWSLPFVSEVDHTSWKTMWFDDFWSVDWNAILGGDNFYIIWAFAEYGMDDSYLGEARDAVREQAPIKITEEDNIESLSSKIANRFIKGD